MNSPQQIVRGLRVSPSGQATIEPQLQDVLFDLSLALEGLTGLPVDMEHVVAALIFASRNGEIDADSQVSADDSAVVKKLVPHIRSVFTLYGGKLSDDN